MQTPHYSVVCTALYAHFIRPDPRYMHISSGLIRGMSAEQTMRAVKDDATLRNIPYGWYLLGEPGTALPSLACPPPSQQSVWSGQRALLKLPWPWPWPWPPPQTLGGTVKTARLCPALSAAPTPRCRATGAPGAGTTPSPARAPPTSRRGCASLGC